MALPAPENRRTVLERVIKRDLTEPVRGAAQSREVALARLAAPLARIVSNVANAWRFERDPGMQDEIRDGLQYAAEETTGALLALIELCTSGDASRLMVRDPDTVDQLIDRPARGFPVWHDQGELSAALEIWTTDLYQDINNALSTFGMGPWKIKADVELIRAVRDCIEISAWLEGHRDEVTSSE
jgi:hypothetical protein